MSRFQNNSLEPVVFKRLDSIKLSISACSVTRFVAFSVYQHAFASLLIYCRLLLQNVQHITDTTYPAILLFDTK